MENATERMLVAALVLQAGDLEAPGSPGLEGRPVCRGDELIPNAPSEGHSQCLS